MSVLALFLIASASATTPTVAPDRFAIVVGYNQADRAELEDLRFADDDAARFFELVSLGAARAHLLTVFDPPSQALYPRLVSIARAPTRAELSRTLREVAEAVTAAREAGRRSEVHFFYAGHGDVDDGVGYVNLVDGRWTRDDLERELLTQIEADLKHVVIDACKSYFMVSGRGPGGERTTTPSAYAGPKPRPGVGLVLSTSNDAQSHEFAALSAGIFSHEVRSALLGAADIDGDRAVDYFELGAFVSAANEGVAIARYRPNVFIRPPEGLQDAPLLKVPDTPRLALDAPIAGRVRITDPRGLRHVDLHKARGRVLRIGLLEPGTYEVELDDVRFEVPAATGEVELSALPAQPKREGTRGLAHEAFEQLFTTPFSPDVVRGFRLGREVETLTAFSSPSEDPTRRRWGAGLAIGGGAGLAIGAVLMAVAADRRASAGGAELDQVQRRARLDEADVWTLGAGSAAGIGLAAAVTGAVLLLTE